MGKGWGGLVTGGWDAMAMCAFNGIEVCRQGVEEKNRRFSRSTSAQLTVDSEAEEGWYQFLWYVTNLRRHPN